ncbi:MAG: hypothetical protein JAZ05_15040, partial [Candidatus Thiodiazotropha taylori]|nr:hypothetical protein [Candidatus Thiodiazotropha taylori]MCW4293333.1 hypothetical protein [Candidatus Thiodiazotropha taylori]
MNVQTDRDMFVSQDGPGYGFNQIDTTDSLGAINTSGSMTGNYLFTQRVLTNKAGVESLGKRQFDLVLGGLILLLASPVMLLTAALIWLS